ncbi:hypothetical protein Q3G72_027170 [Acer saccharum]|nr:hypothetical protein Q3G72_027170 [Acer saccharum]
MEVPGVCVLTVRAERFARFAEVYGVTVSHSGTRAGAEGIPCRFRHARDARWVACTIQCAVLSSHQPGQRQTGPPDRQPVRSARQGHTTGGMPAVDSVRSTPRGYAMP